MPKHKYCKTKLKISMVIICLPLVVGGSSNSASKVGTNSSAGS